MGDHPSSITRSRSNAVARQQPQEQLFDTHPEVSLDFEIVRQAASQKYTRPFLIVDTAIVRAKASRFRAAMPRVRPHYAVKANPDRRVLKVLAQEGCGFEIASTTELDLLLGLGVPAAEVFFSNPVKSREAIAYAAAQGRRVVRHRQHRRAAQGPRDQAGRQALPAHRRPQHRQRLAAVGQVRRRRRRGARDRRGRGQAAAPTSPASPSTSARSAATRRTGASRWRRRGACSTP